jgi:hypothetical protein
MSITPVFKPRHAPVKKVSFDTKSKPYTCPELGRNPGLTDDRFEAFLLPSRIGDQLIYPKKDYK